MSSKLSSLPSSSLSDPSQLSTPSLFAEDEWIDVPDHLSEPQSDTDTPLSEVDSGLFTSSPSRHLNTPSRRPRSKRRSNLWKLQATVKLWRDHRWSLYQFLHKFVTIEDPHLRERTIRLSILRKAVHRLEQEVFEPETRAAGYTQEQGFIREFDTTIRLPFFGKWDLATKLEDIDFDYTSIRQQLEQSARSWVQFLLRMMSHLRTL